MAGYGTDQLFTAWLADQGYELPPGAPAPAVLRQRGSAYIDGLYGPKFVGVPTGGYFQERAWPRMGADAHGGPVAPDVIPVAIEHASYHAAYHDAVRKGGLAVAVSADQAVRRKKIEGIEKEFFEGSGDALADATVRISAVEGLVAPFLCRPMPAIFVV